jgi:hypothetical protein
MVIKDETFIEILKIIIKSDNAHEIATFLKSNSTSKLMDIIISLHLNPNKSFLFEQGDYFSINYSILSSSLEDTLFVKDDLIDLGLYVDNKVFGKVITSNNYSNTHINSYIDMKCQLFFGSCTHETVLCVHDLEKVNKLQIPYFNGTNFDGLIKSKPSRVSKSSENDDGEKPF